MRPCDISERILHAFLDGELKGAQAKEVESQIESCPDCRAKVELWRDAGGQLRDMVDCAVGEVEPLYALQNIRERIAVAEASSPWARLRNWWHDVWVFNRGAVAAMGVAVLLGVVSAAGLVGVLADESGKIDGAQAGVVLESLEYDGEARAAVYNSDVGETTLIWLEPDPNALNRELRY